MHLEIFLVFEARSQVMVDRGRVLKYWRNKKGGVGKESVLLPASGGVVQEVSISV